MGQVRRLLLLPLIALTVTMALAASVATANRIRLNNWTRGIRTAWSSLTFEAGGASVSCGVTLEGTFDSQTYAKTRGLVLGRIPRAAVGTCTGGTVGVLSETLPWRFAWSSWTGTLPNILGFTWFTWRGAFHIRPTGSLRCLLLTSEANPGGFLLNTTPAAAGVNLITVRALEEFTIPLTGEAFCSLFSGRLSGTGTVTVNGESARPNIELI